MVAWLRGLGEIIDDLRGQQRVSGCCGEEAEGAFVRSVPEPILGDGRQVGACQGSQLDVVDGARIRSSQVGECVVLTADKQPYDGQADQPARQRAHDESADLVGPLPVVEGHQHRAGGRGALDDGGNPFGEKERLVG